MKKRKPPKTPKPIVKRLQTVAVSKEPEAPVWGWLKKLGSIGAALALIYTVLCFWPQLSIDPTAAAEPSNPISGYFKITNEQVYPLTDVSIEVSLRCARIGRGDDTSPMDKCLPSMHSSKQLWSNHTLEPHEPYEITPGDLMFVTPGALLYAQISFFVSYRPRKIPYHLSKELRFESRRRSDGKIEWLHIPAD
jgi:hypothetical protein